MKTKFKAFLMYQKYEWEQEPHFFYSRSDYSEGDPAYALVREIEVEEDILDDFDPRPQQIANLKAAKAEVLAKAHVQAENIEEQIQRLLCIEHKPEQV